MKAGYFRPHPALRATLSQRERAVVPEWNFERWVGSNTTARGFTLVELLVAFTILGLLATAAFSGLRTSLNAWSRGNEIADRLRERQATLEVLRSQLQGALPLAYWVEDGVGRRPVLAFEGNSRTLRLVSRSSFVDGIDSVPRWIELKWSRDSLAQLGRLVIEERRILPPNNLAEERTYWQGQVLEGEELQLEFLRRAKAGHPREWLKAWNSAEEHELPAALRLSYLERGKWTRVLVALDYAEPSSRGFFVE